ncbi:MAG: hypothetical protein OXT01_09775 [Rhodospirillaceae bacterium]|nr:hypothetical protein [Rhodospirillaceae bacterium]
MDDALKTVVLFRIGERITLSALILIIAIIVMIAFWRSVQKIDFRITKENIGTGGSVLLGTPIFVLLTLVGYAFVSLSNPITVKTPTEEITGSSRAIPAGGGKVDNAAFDRNNALEKVRSLNCLARNDADGSARDQDNLAAIKVHLLQPVWSGAWGDFDQFSAWALGRSNSPPDPRARAVFDDLHQPC